METTCRAFGLVKVDKCISQNDKAPKGPITKVDNVQSVASTNRTRWPLFSRRIASWYTPLAQTK